MIKNVRPRTQKTKDKQLAIKKLNFIKKPLEQKNCSLKPKNKKIEI